jgi:hypothetical protein
LRELVLVMLARVMPAQVEQPGLEWGQQLELALPERGQRPVLMELVSVMSAQWLVMVARVARPELASRLGPQREPRPELASWLGPQREPVLEQRRAQELPWPVGWQQVHH